MFLQKGKYQIYVYRVSHIEMYKVNWLWQIQRLIFLISYLWLHVQEVITFGFYQPVKKKVTLAGLNSLWQRGYQISVKNRIFDDPFYRKGPLLVILVPGMIQPSGSVKNLMKWGCWGHRGHLGCRGCRGHWGCRGSKVWKITI